MIKRVVCLVLALAVMLSCVCLSVVASASGTLKFKVTSSQIQNGKVTATVSITENPGLISYVLALKFDNTKFSAVYNADTASAVVDKRLFGTSMDEITSNSSGVGLTAIANLDYVTAVATTSGTNVTQTGDLFSVEFNVLDSNMTVFPSELVVTELFTYNPSDSSANNDGQAELQYEITNSNGVYTIEHHKQLASGGYAVETEVLTAPVGSDVTAIPKVYNSHTYDSGSSENKLTGTVNMDGTLVMKCYYNINSYTITYDYQGGTPEIVASTTAMHGEYVTLPDSSSFTNTGYAFGGWYTEQNGNGEKYTQTTAVTKSLTLYAYWAQKPTYSVKHFKQNLDGTYSEYTADTENAFADANEIVTAQPKSYEGFEEDISRRKDEDVVKSDSSTVLEFYYNRKTYEIAFDYQGATTSGIASNTFKYGQNIVLPDVSTFSKNGYNFYGWYTMPSGQGLAVNAGDIVTDNMTVFAAWQQNTPLPPATAVYKIIRYQENLDGTYSAAATENKSGVAGETVSAEVVTIPGFEHDVSNGGNVLSATVASDGSTELKIYYKRVIYTVTFDYQGATTSGIANNTFKHGQTILLPDTTTFAKTGYTFDSWYTAANKAGTKIDSTYTVTLNIALYAGWNVVSNPGAGLGGGGGGGGGGAITLTIKFNSNGGSEVESIKVEQGNKVAEPTAPTKDGYTFAGWYVDKGLKTKYNFDNIVKAGMTLYAAWTEVTEEDKDKDNQDDETNVSQPENEISKVLNTNPGVTYIQGDDNGNFNPENKITRAEVSVMIYRLLVDTHITTETNFVDIPHDEWYSMQVKTLASKGIIKGYDDGCFYPSHYVTRAEFATILSRFVQQIEGEEIFPDVSEDHWAFGYVTTAYKNGWITGYDNGDFGPDMNLSRAEAVTIMGRILGKTITSGNECKFPDVPEDHWAYNYICAASN